MTWTMALFTYINLWWISLFFVWPFAVEAKTADQASVTQGYAAAPGRIYWKKMLVGTSLLGAVFTCITALLIYVFT